jgi:hypothetical protein
MRTAKRVEEIPIMLPSPCGGCRFWHPHRGLRLCGESRASKRTALDRPFETDRPQDCPEVTHQGRSPLSWQESRSSPIYRHRTASLLQRHATATRFALAGVVISLSQVWRVGSAHVADTRPAGHRASAPSLSAAWQAARCTRRAARRKRRWRWPRRVRACRPHPRP